MALRIRPAARILSRSLATRSASEATRFTPTGPQASSRPSKPSTERPVAYSRPSGSTPYATTIELTNPPPPNETPAQKVHRLREAALRMKASKETTFEKVVRRSRVWADRAHHTVVALLVSVSLLTMLLAVWSVGDMIHYNRRKRNVWFQEQQRNYDRALERAQAAEAEGTLTGDLALILNHHRAILEWEITQEAKKGPIKRALEWVFGGLATEEPPGGKLNLGDNEIRVLAEGGRLVRINEQGKPIDDEGNVVAVNVEEIPAGLAQDVPISTPDGHNISSNSRSGGMLDLLAEEVAVSTATASQDLWNRIRGR